MQGSSMLGASMLGTARWRLQIDGSAEQEEPGVTARGCCSRRDPFRRGDGWESGFVGLSVSCETERMGDG